MEQMSLALLLSLEEVVASPGQRLSKQEEELHTSSLSVEEFFLDTGGQG